jgi:sigma-E factor negative regulatory protein RseA
VNKNNRKRAVMSDSLKESLSALMDDEADDLELRRVLKILPEQPELEQVWARYHLVSASLKREIHHRPGVDLLGRIQAGLAEDDIPSLPARQTSEPVAKSFWRPLGQAGIAASVALAVLFTAHSINVAPEAVDGMSSMAVSSSRTTQGASPGFIPANSNDTIDLGRVAVLNDDTPALDSAARDRLRQAVYQQFEETPLAVEIPVNFIER